MLAAGGPFDVAAGAELMAYEIHMGRTEVGEAARPFRVTGRGDEVGERFDGAVNSAGNVLGTYLHGLLENGALRRALLEHLAARRADRPDPRWGSAPRALAGYDRLADIVKAALDIAAIAKLVGLSVVV